MSEEYSSSSTSQTERKPSPPKIIRRIIRKREEARGGIVDKYWQPALVLLGLVTSGVVAYKVFFSGRKQQKQQEQMMSEFIKQMQLQQQQQQTVQQQAPQLVAQDPSQLVPMQQHPMIPNFSNNGSGNGIQIHNGNGHSGQTTLYQRPTEALSSYAEKMIRNEQFKQIPIYEDRGHTQTADTRDLPMGLNRQNIPIHSAHNIPSPPPLPKSSDHSTDIA